MKNDESENLCSNHKNRKPINHKGMAGGFTASITEWGGGARNPCDYPETCPNPDKRLEWTGFHRPSRPDPLRKTAPSGFPSMQFNMSCPPCFNPRP
jgi:hypothetical protein